MKGRSLSGIRRRHPMMRKLIKGGHVISMDPVVGSGKLDILVEDDRIVEVARKLDAQDAELIDASGCIVIPGLVNAHMHTWQTALRGIAANWTLPEYFGRMHAGLATLFGPDDIHIATLVGAFNQINSGT